jgi:hypothetical protein
MNNNVVTNAMRICDHIVVFKIVDQRRGVAKEAVKINPSPVRVWLKHLTKQGAIQWLQVCNLVCCVHTFQTFSTYQNGSKNTCMLCTDNRTLNIGETKLGQHSGDMSCQIADGDVFEMDIWGGNVGCALFG